MLYNWKNYCILALVVLMMMGISYKIYADGCCGQLDGCLCSGGVEWVYGCWYKFSVAHENEYLNRTDVTITDGIYDPSVLQLEYEYTQGNCFIYSRFVELEKETDYDFYFTCNHGDRDPESGNYSVDTSENEACNY